MMGHNTRSESLFYYFRLEDHVPDDHLLRLIDRHIDVTFVRESLKTSYSHTGRPSIDPEVMLRILLIGYLYGITSERRLVEDVGMHLAYRWFTGLGFDQEIPHHSTFSKNRHGRFQESPPEFAAARRARNKIEALFSELRNQIRLRKVRLRGLKHVREQFILAATVQNLKRLIKFLKHSKEPIPAMA